MSYSQRPGTYYHHASSDSEQPGICYTEVDIWRQPLMSSPSLNSLNINVYLVVTIPPPPPESLG